MAIYRQLTGKETQNVYWTGHPLTTGTKKHPERPGGVPFLTFHPDAKLSAITDVGRKLGRRNFSVEQGFEGAKMKTGKLGSSLRDGL
jgi:hypothetical protein